MADDKTFTKAELDAAIAVAVGKVQESIDSLETKNAELVGEVRKAKNAARAASEIKPEDFAAVEAERDKALTDLTAANKSLKEATVNADKATKALETEQGAARTYALEAEVASAIASGNVVPALVPAFKAMVMGQAKAELVDGKYVVTIGDKAAKDHISGYLDSEDGKAFKAAAINGGGGAPGGKTGEGAKQVTRSAFDAMDHGARAAFAKDGGRVVDAAA